MEFFRFRPDKEAQKRAEERKALELRAEKVLKKIDFDTLGAVFAEERERAGLGRAATNLQKRDRIKLRPIKGKENGMAYIAYYAMFPNKIVADVERIMRYRPEENFENAFLSIICHEETHSVSTNPSEHSGLSPLLHILSGKYTSKTGVEYITSEGDDFFHMLNEAVTDRFAEEVYDEYLKRTGDRASITNSDETQWFLQSYLNERNILQAFISALSRTTAVPEDVVWSSIKQSYLSNTDLAGSELVKLYEEVVGRNIAEIIKNPTKSHGVSRNAIRELKEINATDVDVFSQNVVHSIETMDWSGELKERAASAVGGQK